MAQMAGLRWHDWLLSVGQNGCFYSSANTETLHQAELWVERYLDWCGFWADFLEDRTVVDGRRVYTHERLRRARSSLSSLVSAGTLFTYLDPALAKAGPLPSTNNMIEGGVNS